ncbi:hypothetical protein [Janthinobacterium agaricidamnosum]|uniref:Uncharacterized protein n=1 Tax=Janthinobacterium agaricidamnosum NBRC 102515 = DSM 9628 TaxID=1349767 RepID=W0V7I5_9BURK|nr:hypothetical protein [Janthinobacterium agaricidamnosum]CDG83232.1 hypothetical protein GJA_2601 [Janthinobacterium agaricidamnosum NBRC 102515 = DSM 9628]
MNPELRAGAARRFKSLSSQLALALALHASAHAVAAGQAPPAAAPAAAAAPSAPLRDILGLAREAAGNIDKSMRSETGQPALSDVAPDFKNDGNDKFDKAIEAAHVQRGAPRIENYVLSDGRPATKVTGAGGSYCVAQRLNSSVAVDPFKDGAAGDGNKTQRVPCP